MPAYYHTERDGRSFVYQYETKMSHNARCSPSFAEGNWTAWSRAKLCKLSQPSSKMECVVTSPRTGEAVSYYEKTSPGVSDRRSSGLGSSRHFYGGRYSIVIALHVVYMSFVRAMDLL